MSASAAGDGEVRDSEVRDSEVRDSEVRDSEVRDSEVRDSEVRESRLANAALRCYPARWRRRHADEAAELAALLIADGTPAVSIAWNYLVGAARAWLTPRPGRPLSAVAAALLAAACLLGLSAALVAESAPARAVGTSQSQPGSTP